MLDCALLLLSLFASTGSAQPAATLSPAPVEVAISQETASQRFERLAEDYWETQMQLSPLYATFVNHPRYQDRLDDPSAAGRALDARERRRLLGGLSAIDRATLTEGERVSWDIMKLELDRSIEGDQHKFWQWNIDHMDGPQSWIPSVVEMGQPMKTAEDAEALLLRMKAMPGYFAALSSNLREGLREGRIAAKVPVEKLLSQLDGLLKTPVGESPFAMAGKKLPPELRGPYLPQILAAVETHVFAAYADYQRFLKETYLPRARAERIGLSDLPGGLDAYRYQIRLHTTLDFTPDQLHQLGLEEVKGLRAEMQAVARRMGHRGELNAFMDKVRHDPKNFFSTREEVLKNAQDLVAAAQLQLPKYFGRLPATPLLVKPIEDYKEKNDVAARYYEPADDLTRPGIYYINTYQPETRPRFSMTSLAAHEGVPGHHLQIALAIEKRDLPTFRRHGGFNAFVEGWALYSERLAAEMGLYKDDLSRVGMISDQALRACRLVVDTGIHARRWSRQQAIDYMKQNTPMSEDEIIAEVDRYTIWPGQALSYKVGQREIMALRLQSKKALGSKFDLKRFHDDVLKNGAVPLSVLRSVILK